MAGSLPLYAQVRAQLIDRLSAGEWAPGTALPSEMALADALGVSQGTARKAIDSLVSDGALVRAQGKGTFVAQQTPELANFRFLPLIDAAGRRVIPELARQIITRTLADDGAARALGIPTGSETHLIERVRRINGKKAIFETMTVPHALMPSLGDDQRLPNALYPHYQSHFAVTVLRTWDQLRAINATRRIARMLGCDEGTAVLQAERVAYDLKDVAVEHRLSYFLTIDHAYAVGLR